MILYPKLYLKNLQYITIDMLRKYQIKGLILDVDNTIIDYNRNILDGTKEWCDNLKNHGIKFCILSNSNKKEKVAKVAEQLELPYLYFAKKPFKKGFKKAQKILDLPESQIAAVGDQIFTDVIGANNAKMFPILTEPLGQKDIWITLIKRPLENFIIKSYLKKQK